MKLSTLVHFMTQARKLSDEDMEVLWTLSQGEYDLVDADLADDLYDTLGQQGSPELDSALAEAAGYNDVRSSRRYGPSADASRRAKK